ncbi:MAG: hypothetical protein AAGE43_07890 [Pseudomonadota bacterium]
MTEQYIRSIEAQIIGRVFTHDDAIHFVLDTDSETGLARCSRRTTEGPAIVYLPMTDVHGLLSQANRLEDATTEEQTPLLAAVG